MTELEARARWICCPMCDRKICCFGASDCDAKRWMKTEVTNGVGTLETEYCKFDEYVVKDILDDLVRYKKLCKTCAYNKDGWCKRVSGKRINIKAINYCGLWKVGEK